MRAVSLVSEVRSRSRKDDSCGPKLGLCGLTKLDNLETSGLRQGYALSHILRSSIIWEHGLRALTGCGRES